MNKVSPDVISELLARADIQVDTIFDKVTVVTARLQNGFAIVESSGCVDPENYDVDLGVDVCLGRIEDKLWMLEGYCLQKALYEETPIAEADCEENRHENALHDFGWALRMMKSGWACMRRGWNGKGIFIALQEPDSKSKMSAPYIYIDTTGLVSDNADAPRSRVPWLASQTDMLATDWELCGFAEAGV